MTNTTTETPIDYRNDPRYKYAFAYGVLSHCMTVVAELVERSKREGEMIDPNNPDLKWAITQFKIADDNLHTDSQHTRYNTP